MTNNKSRRDILSGAAGVIAGAFALPKTGVDPTGTKLLKGMELKRGLAWGSADKAVSYLKPTLEALKDFNYFADPIVREPVILFDPSGQWVV